MSQQPLFPDNTISLPFRSSSYAKWLASIGVKNPVTMEERYKEAYPNVDLEAEGKIAMSWNESRSHPYRNIAKFLHNWYAKKERDYVLGVKTQAALSPSRTFKKGYVKTNGKDTD